MLYLCIIVQAMLTDVEPVTLQANKASAQPFNSTPCSQSRRMVLEIDHAVHPVHTECMSRHRGNLHGCAPDDVRGEMQLM